MNTTDTDVIIPEVTPALERGPQWLRNKRRQARESFNNTPLPRRGLHLWRYTDPSSFLFDHNTAVEAGLGDTCQEIEEPARKHLESDRLAGFAIDVCGREIKCLIADEPAKQGIIVSSLSDAVETHREIVEDHLYGLVNESTGKFQAMNGALWNDGVFVYVPDGVAVTEPIHLVRLAGPAGSAQYPRLLVVAGKNTELTLIDEYTGGSAGYKDGLSHANGVVEIYGQEESRTRYVCLQQYGTGMNAFLTHRASINRGASMHTVPLSFGSALSKQNFGVSLDGEGADSRMYGLLFGVGRQHIDNHTLHHHAHGKTTSNIDFKVVLGGKAQSAYTGLIRIDQDSQVCEAYQENRNLLLSDGARAESIPELEILNEEVSCSHGATVGPIDPDTLYYLESRGIPETEATRMLISGFVAPTLKLVPDDLRERISSYIERRLKDI